MIILKQLVRPEILRLKPYVSARGEFSGSKNIQLDANESPWFPYGTNSGLNRYPEPQPQLLKQRLSDIYQVRSQEILITRGMDEGIDLLIRTFCRPGKDNIVIIPPTFSYYEVAACINEIGVIKATLDNLEKGKILFLCTPNNPTGESISIDKIAAICNSFNGIVAVDEAYIEFSYVLSATTLLKKFPNLVVMRTLSKAYAMAGIRIGSIIANSEVITILQRVLSPYPISQVCSELALQALSPLGLYYTKNNISKIKLQRQYLEKMLVRCPDVVNIYQSDANFILVIFKDAEAIYKKLKSSGIIVRNRSNEIANSLRITVGTSEENKMLLSALGVLNEVITPTRKATLNRRTTETEILCEVVLDNQGLANVSTEIRFFDHMLEQLAKHSGISILLRAKGDIDIDSHHTIEDVAIVLGSTLKEALGDKFGIERYGFVLPMDEAITDLSIDLSGRGYCTFNANFTSEAVGDFPTEMVEHFFSTLSMSLGATINIKVRGKNTHHMVESCFKCFARALGQAVIITGNSLPSTKGVL
jgi:histidinol-phosphate aminotransferase